MRRQFTATSIRSRLSSDRRQIILEIDGTGPGVSVAINPDVMKGLISSVAWLQETQPGAPPEGKIRESNVLRFPPRTE